MKRELALLICLALMFAAGSCRSKDNQEHPLQATGSSGSNAAVSPWKIELRTEPEHPRMVKPTAFTVHIVDGNGRTVDDAQVRGSLSMKTMDMGKIELQLQPKGNGDYEGTVKELDMSGPWDFTVEASKAEFHALKAFEIVVYD